MVTEVKQNAQDLEKDLIWFKEILTVRSLLNSNTPGTYQDVYEVPVPVLHAGSSPYADFVQSNRLDFEERFLLVLALVPHIRPELLDAFLQRNELTQQIYTEFGGKRGKHHNGFIPTGETLMFILAGLDLARRFNLFRLFDIDHVFYKRNILSLEEVDKGEPVLSGSLMVSRDVLDLFTLGKISKPSFSSSFPAKLLTTEMEWEDLILSGAARASILEIETWLEHHETLWNEWGMYKKLKPGFKALFYGPPGTGKSLAAASIGKKTGRNVYRIDLSKIISKYIGETEKNLAQIFDKAEDKDWILFFDEADALFGKRTGVSDAHDRYANQEVSYLLQRIEDYRGLIILASNLRNNMDEAFSRRFQAMVHFGMPQMEERLQLWEKGFSTASVLDSRINLPDIARDYELAGGSIINVIHYSSLMALKRKEKVIHYRDVMEGIRREFSKSGRTL